MAKDSRHLPKAHSRPETSPPLPNDQPSKVENIISVVLGLAVVLVIGAMIVNTIKNRQNPTEPVGSTGPTGNTTEGTPGTYTVVEGDTLWSIAEKSYNDGYKWPEIQKANNITDASTIEEGTKLTIPSLPDDEVVAVVITGTPGPTKEITATPPPATGSASGATGPTDGPEKSGEMISASTDSEYTVASGDTLWKIAQDKLGDPYRWGEIAKLNNLSNPDLIFAGNVFKLPTK